MHVRQVVKITKPEQIVGRVIEADNLALNLNATAIGLDAAKTGGKAPAAASGLATLGPTSIVVQQPPNISATKVTSGRFGMTQMPDIALDKIMVGQGAGNSPVAEDKHAADTIGESTKVSEVLRNSNDPVGQSTTGSGYIKSKETKLNADLAFCRLKFTVINSTDYTAYGKVYKNGVAIGAEKSKTGAGSTEFSEDFSGWVLNDLIQIYVKTNNPGTTASASQMRFYYDADDEVTHIGGVELVTNLPTQGRDPTISTTNQDP